MNHRSAFVAVLPAVALMASCATAGSTAVSSHTATAIPAVTTTAVPPPTSTRSLPPSTTTRAAVLPAVLVGAWSSSGEDTEIAYRFLADGRYRSIEILSQPRPAGVFEFRRQQDGTARVSGGQMRLRPTTSVTSRQDPEDPAGDYENRPSAKDERDYTWHVSGTTLVLTDTDGLTLQLERQA